MIRVTVCTSCESREKGFSDQLRQALDGRAEVNETECMSGCVRGPAVAVRSAGKTAYLFGEITATDIPDLHRFVTLYAQSRDGSFADARVLGGLRMKALARIPG